MPHRQKKILVVEDSRSINDLLVTQLEQRLKIEIVSAFTMAQAQEILKDEKQCKQFFLSILDLNLPDAPDGEIVDFVMGKDIPCIILTSNRNEVFLDSILNKGAIDILNKSNRNEIQYVLESAERLFDNFNRKVLAVDDSDVSLMLLTTLLEKQNLKVLQAKDGTQALKLLNLHKDICMVVTDYNMPKMDGVELIYNIRRDYTRDELSIIGISSTDDKKVSVRLLKSGANDFISRPFSHEEFNCRINQNIDAINNYKKLREATIKDFLTGLYNRKYIFETGDKLFNNAVRENIKLTTAMIDIDHFKKINDNHGHNIGDLALKHVADLIKDSIREGDILARMGGEEFCIFCINLDKANASGLFERIRKEVETNPLQFEDLLIPVTVSVGFSSVIATSLENMINDADNALYDAKNLGRNRVVCFDDEL